MSDNPTTQTAAQPCNAADSHHRDVRGAAAHLLRMATADYNVGPTERVRSDHEISMSDRSEPSLRDCLAYTVLCEYETWLVPPVRSLIMFPGPPGGTRAAAKRTRGLGHSPNETG